MNLMPQPAVVPAGQDAAPAEGGSKWTGIARSMAMFMAMQWAMKYGMSYLGMNQSAQPPAAIPSDTPPAATPDSAVPLVSGQHLVNPVWPLGTDMSMLLYTSTSPFSEPSTSTYITRFDGIKYGSTAENYAADLILDVPHAVRNGNASWWMDVILLKNGGEVTGRSIEDIAVSRKQLTRFMPKRRARKEKKLIGGTEEEEAVEEEAPIKEIVAHWSRNLTLAVVASGGQVDYNKLPPVVSPFYNLVPTADGKPTQYYPPVFPNDFWLLRENMWPINSTDTQLPLHIDAHGIGGMKFQIFSSLNQGFDQAAAQQGGGAGAEMDEVKRMFTETNPYLLITTAVVTVLHMIFEFLAFSSDIGHWRKKGKENDLVGVSLRTILTNVFVQFVILLYLQDSSEETSMMILFTQGIGLVIEAWKITKVVNIRVRQTPGSLIGYTVTFEDKKVLTEDEKKTQEYDKLAFKLVSYGAVPLLAIYSGYSLLYLTHRSWYSYIVTTLAQAIYMFGFVQLIPQLIINYKLKSVAHMPMKAMVYKTLATVVDDFFAFCIRMPWLHRLACFRDDVVFLILLYQRWIYRVDYSRVNEYGQVAEGKVEPVGDVKDVKSAEAKESKKDK